MGGGYATGLRNSTARPEAFLLYHSRGLRPALLLSVLLVSAVASAQDARVTFLAKQLRTQKDPRLRAQTVLTLGQTGSETAIDPLCDVLKTDADALVRSAAASALGELRPDSESCLKSAKDKDANVIAAIAKALEVKAGAKLGALYMAIETNDKVGIPAEALTLANELLRKKLETLGAAIAPPGETKAAAQTLIKAKKLRGFLLRVNLLPHDTKGLKLEMLVMTYPDQALQGSWNVKASGGKTESLLKLMVPRVVDDAASELEWKGQ